MRTIWLDDAGSAAVIIDQTLLPGETRELRLRTPEDFHDAILRLAVRGAPAIGIAAAYGVYLAAKAFDTGDYGTFRKAVADHCDYLNSSRPTAVNLKWATDRMRSVVEHNSSRPVNEIISLLRRECQMIGSEDAAMCEGIGRHALTLLRPGMGVLTHCNAGRLATGGIGTATAGIYLADSRGYGLRVYCDETRPLLQGARLTAYELARKSKTVGLSSEEKREQHTLRQEYLAKFRKSFRVHLDNIEVVDTPEEACRLRRKYALRGDSPSGRDATSEN
ncbi:MAG: DUF896 domain-containing protein [Clostridiales Family XIII bacterium]|nr:DUF896 domain-containing protein [Clostridiales Family XIII bacterium]